MYLEKKQKKNIGKEKDEKRLKSNPTEFYSLLCTKKEKKNEQPMGYEVYV